MNTITIRTERPVEQGAREALLDVAYGAVRHGKPSARLRRRRLPADGLALVALEKGRMLGTVRLWNVDAGGKAALLLGPLAVHPDARKRGIGGELVRRALVEAHKFGHKAVLLVGDETYYGRFGFSAEKTGGLTIAGADPARLLAVELTASALNGAYGQIVATGRREPIAALAAIKDKATGKARARLIPQAA